MRAYKQLTSEQRYQISALKRMEHSQTEIAKELEVHKSTISRELRRNVGERGYRPKQANEKARERREQSTSKKRISAETWKVVEEKVRQDWSPEQVSGWLKKHQELDLSPEWIYQHILVDQQTGGDLNTHLRQHGKRRKRYGKYDRRGTLPNRVSIEERPQLVEQRERLGDWEVDTLVGKGHRGALVSLVERKSRYTLLQPVTQRLANLVADATVSLLHPFAASVYTITGDNGKEFAEHVRIAETLKANFYFAHPYAAWERGTNENTNGLVRQYFPKKTDFSKVTLSETQLAVDKLNHRPRKCLDFKSPFEVFFDHSVALQS
jgi:IS30 family transposase